MHAQPIAHSFSELLKIGDVPRALALRLESLEAAARYYRQELEAAKCSGAAVGVVGLVLSASPAIAVVAALGLGSYVLTLARDYSYTKRLCPVPLVRKSLGDLVLGVGLAADNERQEDDPLLDVLGYLPPPQAWEYELIACSEREIAAYLASVTAEDRLQAYLFMLRQTRLRGKFRVPQAVNTPVVADVLPQPVADDVWDDEPTPTHSHPVSTAPAPSARVIKTEREPAFFDWRNIADSDEHPVIGVVGAQGAGKSRLVKYLVRHVVCADEAEFDAIAFDMFGSLSQWGFDVAAEPEDITDKMSDDLDIIMQRTADYREGVREFLPLIRIFEESRDGIPEIKALGKSQSKVLADWMRKFGSATRKLKARAIYVNTQFDAESMALKANARNAVTLIFPGDKGVAAAMNDTQILKLGSTTNADIRAQLERSLRRANRPALVYHNGTWSAASVPELNENGDILP